MNENAALDFIVYSLFGDMSSPEEAVINRAYVDMASHTLTGFDDYNEKWRCRYEGSKLIKESLNLLSEKDTFDTWHKTLCEGLMDVYPKQKLTYGQAQKWVNMTIKYVYVLKRLEKMDQSVFPFISKAHAHLFHPPVDSYVLREVLKDHCSWSGIENNTKYEEKRAKLKDKGFDFKTELSKWPKIAEKQRQNDKKSYAYFLKSNHHVTQN